MTEAGYTPTHFTIGEIYSYNRPPGVNHEDVAKLFSNFLETAMVDQDVNFILAEELSETSVTSENRAVIELELSFQSGSREVTGSSPNANILGTFTIRRASDGAVWREGSIRSSDMMISKGASVDQRASIDYAAQAMVDKCKKLLAGEQKHLPALTIGPNEGPDKEIEENVERTLCIIKPDGVEKGNMGNIVARIEKENFNILGLKRARLTRADAEHFYAVHHERPFFGELVEYMTRGPVVLIALERDNAVDHWRTVIGNTDPQKAEDGTIRKLYGEDIGTNTVHGSDSAENGRIEVGVFFSETELINQI